MTDTDFHTAEADTGTVDEAHLDFGTPEPDEPQKKPATKKRAPRKPRRRAAAAAGSPRQIIEKFQDISELDVTTRLDICAVAGLKERTDDPVDLTEAIAAGNIDTSATEQAITLMQDVQGDPVTVAMSLMGMDRTDRVAIWKTLTQVGGAKGVLKGSDMETSTELHKALSAATDDLSERLFTALEIVRG